MTRNDLIKEYPAFFDRFIIPEGKEQGLLKIAELNHANKATLRKMLSIPDNGRKPLEMEGCKPTLRFKRTLKLLASCVDSRRDNIIAALKDDDILKNNRLPNGAKLSKAILKAVVRDSIPSHSAINMMRVYGELPKLPEIPSTAGDETHTISLVVQNLFSEIAGNTNRVYLSTNPWDILNASNGGFVSCFALGREYGTSPFSFVTDSRTIIGYVSSSGDMLHAAGRFWIFFNEDFTEVIVHKAYGTTGKDVLDLVIKQIADLLGKNREGLVEPDWYVKENYEVAFGLGTGAGIASKAANGVGNVYIDRYAQALLYDRGNGGTHAGFLMTFTPPICPVCGEYFDSQGESYSALCRKCLKIVKRVRNVRCVECGRTLLETKTERTTRGRHLCTVCISSSQSRWIKCKECGKYHGKSDSCSCSVESKQLCLTCFKLKQNVTNVKGYVICNDCVKGIGETKCFDCGATENLVLAAGHMRCQSHALKKIIPKSAYKYMQPQLSRTFAEKIKSGDLPTLASPGTKLEENRPTPVPDHPRNMPGPDDYRAELRQSWSRSTP